MRRRRQSTSSGHRKTGLNSGQENEHQRQVRRQIQKSKQSEHGDRDIPKMSDKSPITNKGQPHQRSQPLPQLRAMASSSKNTMNSAKKPTPINGPGQRYGHFTFIYKDRLYVYGGHTIPHNGMMHQQRHQQHEKQQKPKLIVQQDQKLQQSAEKSPSKMKEKCKPKGSRRSKGRNNMDQQYQENSGRSNSRSQSRSRRYRHHANRGQKNNNQNNSFSASSPFITATGSTEAIDPLKLFYMPLSHGNHQDHHQSNNDNDDNNDKDGNNDDNKSDDNHGKANTLPPFSSFHRQSSHISNTAFKWRSVTSTATCTAYKTITQSSLAFQAHCLYPKRKKLFVFGGSDLNGICRNYLFKLDLQNYEWIRCEQRGATPQPQEHAHMKLVSANGDKNNYLVLLGGMTKGRGGGRSGGSEARMGQGLGSGSSPSSPSSSLSHFPSTHYIYIYQLDARTWQRVYMLSDTLIPPRIGAAVCFSQERDGDGVHQQQHHQNKIYIFGGYAIDVHGKQYYLNDMYEITFEMIGSGSDISGNRGSGSKIAAGLGVGGNGSGGNSNGNGRHLAVTNVKVLCQMKQSGNSSQNVKEKNNKHLKIGVEDRDENEIPLTQPEGTANACLSYVIYQQQKGNKSVDPCYENLGDGLILYGGLGERVAMGLEQAGTTGKSGSMNSYCWYFNFAKQTWVNLNKNLSHNPIQCFGQSYFRNTNNLYIYGGVQMPSQPKSSSIQLKQSSSTSSHIPLCQTITIQSLSSLQTIKTNQTTTMITSITQIKINFPLVFRQLHQRVGLGRKNKLHQLQVSSSTFSHFFSQLNCNQQHDLYQSALKSLTIQQLAASSPGTTANNMSSLAPSRVMPTRNKENRNKNNIIVNDDKETLEAMRYDFIKQHALGIQGKGYKASHSRLCSRSRSRSHSRSCLYSSTFVSTTNNQQLRSFIDSSLIQQIFLSVKFPYAAVGLIVDNFVNHQALFCDIRYHTAVEEKSRHQRQQKQGSLNLSSSSSDYNPSSTTQPMLSFQSDANFKISHESTISMLNCLHRGIKTHAQGTDKRMKAEINSDSMKMQVMTNFIIGGLRLGGQLILVEFGVDGGGAASSGNINTMNVKVIVVRREGKPGTATGAETKEKVIINEENVKNSQQSHSNIKKSSFKMQLQQLDDCNKQQIQQEAIPTSKHTDKAKDKYKQSHQPEPQTHKSSTSPTLLPPLDLQNGRFVSYYFVVPKEQILSFGLEKGSSDVNRVSCESKNSNDAYDDKDKQKKLKVKSGTAQPLLRRISSVRQLIMQDKRYSRYICKAMDAIRKGEIRTCFYILSLRDCNLQYCMPTSMKTSQSDKNPTSSLPLKPTQLQIYPQPLYNDIYHGDNYLIQQFRHAHIPIQFCIDISLKHYLSALYIIKPQTDIFLSISNFASVQIQPHTQLNIIDELCRTKDMYDLQDWVKMQEYEFKFIELYYNFDLSILLAYIHHLEKKINFVSNGLLYYHKNRLVKRHAVELGGLLEYAEVMGWRYRKQFVKKHNEYERRRLLQNSTSCSNKNSSPQIASNRPEYHPLQNFFTLNGDFQIHESIPVNIWKTVTFLFTFSYSQTFTYPLLIERLENRFRQMNEQLARLSLSKPILQIKKYLKDKQNEKTRENRQRENKQREKQKDKQRDKTKSGGVGSGVGSNGNNNNHKRTRREAPPSHSGNGGRGRLAQTATTTNLVKGALPTTIPPTAPESKTPTSNVVPAPLKYNNQPHHQKTAKIGTIDNQINNQEKNQDDNVQQKHVNISDGIINEYNENNNDNYNLNNLDNDKNKDNPKTTNNVGYGTDIDKKQQQQQLELRQKSKSLQQQNVVSAVVDLINSVNVDIDNKEKVEAAAVVGLQSSSLKISNNNNDDYNNNKQEIIQLLQKQQPIQYQYHQQKQQQQQQQQQYAFALASHNLRLNNNNIQQQQQRYYHQLKQQKQRQQQQKYGFGFGYKQNDIGNINDVADNNNKDIIYYKKQKQQQLFQQNLKPPIEQQLPPPRVLQSQLSPQSSSLQQQQSSLLSSSSSSSLNYLSATAKNRNKQKLAKLRSQQQSNPQKGLSWLPNAKQLNDNRQNANENTRPKRQRQQTQSYSSLNPYHAQPSSPFQPFQPTQASKSQIKLFAPSQLSAMCQQKQSKHGALHSHKLVNSYKALFEKQLMQHNKSQSIDYSNKRKTRAQQQTCQYPKQMHFHYKIHEQKVDEWEMDLGMGLGADLGGVGAGRVGLELGGLLRIAMEQRERQKERQNEMQNISKNDAQEKIQKNEGTQNHQSENRKNNTSKQANPKINE